MYLNTFPTCFEGPRVRKIQFRDPEQENRVDGPRTEFSMQFSIALNLEYPGFEPNIQELESILIVYMCSAYTKAVQRCQGRPEGGRMVVVSCSVS